MKRYTSEEKEWLKENYSGLGYKACMNYLCRSKASICQTARNLGCRIPLSLRNKRHSETVMKAFTPSILPEIFSNVKTKETAYILGLLWADGWVQNNNSYSINIKLITEDFEEIIPLFYSIGKWKRYDYFPSGRKPTTQLRVSGKSLADYFLSMNYNSKSNYPATKVLSTIPNEFVRYWWRGYFDGDGHIRGHHPYRLEFSSTWNQDWSFLPKEYPFTIQQTIGKHSYSKARLCSKKEIIKFGNMIWNEWDGIGLTRKYNTFLEISSK